MPYPQYPTPKTASKITKFKERIRIRDLFMKVKVADADESAGDNSCQFPENLSLLRWELPYSPGGIFVSIDDPDLVPL